MTLSALQSKLLPYTDEVMRFISEKKEEIDDILLTDAEIKAIRKEKMILTLDEVIEVLKEVEEINQN